MGGGHAVLGVVEDLQLHGGRGGRPRPADDILGALPQVHHPHPDDDKPPPQPGVQVPDAEREEEEVEELVAQLRAQAEEIVEEAAADGELLATVLLRQGVAARPPPPPRQGARPARHGPVPGGMPLSSRPLRGRGSAVNDRPPALGSLLRAGPGRRPLHPAEPLEGGHFLRVLQVGGQPGQQPAESHGESTRPPARGGRRAAKRCPGRANRSLSGLRLRGGGSRARHGESNRSRRSALEGAAQAVTAGLPPALLGPARLGSAPLSVPLRPALAPFSPPHSGARARHHPIRHRPAAPAHNPR